MDSKDYLKDISEIKTLMNKSSRFISLSGLSGILAGIYALIGAGYYYFFIIGKDENILLSSTIIILLVGIASTITTIYFTSKRAKLTNEKVGSTTTTNLLIPFISTLFIGFICILIFYINKEYNYLLGLLILFYGLALLHASQKTSNIVAPLGYLEIITGLLCIAFFKYSFWFWVIGVGIVHLVYGSIIYFKYDKKQ